MTCTVTRVTSQQGVGNGDKPSSSGARPTTQHPATVSASCLLFNAPIYGKVVTSPSSNVKHQVPRRRGGKDASVVTKKLRRPASLQAPQHVPQTFPTLHPPIETPIIHQPPHRRRFTAHRGRLTFSCARFKRFCTFLAKIPVLISAMMTAE